MRRAWRSATVVALVAVVGGCVGTTGRGDFEEIIQERGGGYTPALPLEARDRVAERLGVDDFDIRHMSVDPPAELVTFDVRDPQAPGNLDTYTIRRGRIEEVEPIQLSANDDLARQTFPLSTLALDRVDDMVDAALAGFDSPNAHVISLSAGTTGAEGTAGWSMSLESDRARASATFTAGGVLIEVTPT